MTPHKAAPPAPLKPWSRERLLVVLGVGIVCAFLLLTGLGISLWRAVTSHPDVTTDSSSGSSQSAAVVRDRIAAEPMLVTALEDAAKGVPAVVQPAGITVPEPTILREHQGVPTGFPRTPEGAVGQLAAITATALESMDLATVQAIHAEWVAQGGPTLQDWIITRSVQSFLGATSDAGRPATVKATPAAAQVKGTDGPDWVLACVLLDVHATLRTEARVGFGHCERMAWDGRRWVVDAGVSPAFAPSTWPGSQKAADAGWRPWVVEGVRP